jgi:hypothetical protein
VFLSFFSLRSHSPSSPTSLKKKNSPQLLLSPSPDLPPNMDQPTQLGEERAREAQSEQKIATIVRDAELGTREPDLASVERVYRSILCSLADIREAKG